MLKLKQKLFLVLLSLSLLNPSLAIAATTGTTTTTTKPATTATTPPATTQSTDTVTGAPEYKNVDVSVEEYLCTPSEKADGHDLERCVNKLYRFGIAFGAIALVFFLVLAGYFYITGGESGKAKGKGIVQNALVGMALLVGSYVLLAFINPNLVAFKPIQPPIFSADELPACDEIGFEDDCVVLNPDGSSTTVSTGGAKVACPGGKIVSAKSLGLKTKQADEQICEEFAKILLQAVPKLSGLDWRITDTIGSGHLSMCHKAGNAYSGTCADIGLTTKTTAGWNQVCKAMKEAGLSPVNEADNAASDCPKYGTYSTTTGQHIHVNWRK